MPKPSADYVAPKSNVTTNRNLPNNESVNYTQKESTNSNKMTTGTKNDYYERELSKLKSQYDLLNQNRLKLLNKEKKYNNALVYAKNIKSSIASALNKLNIVITNFDKYFKINGKSINSDSILIIKNNLNSCSTTISTIISKIELEIKNLQEKINNINVQIDIIGKQLR